MRIAGTRGLAAWSRSTLPTRVRQPKAVGKGGAMHMRNTSGHRGIGDRAASRAIALFALGLFAVNGGASTPAAAVQSSSAQTGAVQLVQEYLAALGSAGSNLSKVEAALKASGPSATTAQSARNGRASRPRLGAGRGATSCPAPDHIGGCGPADKLHRWEGVPHDRARCSSRRWRQALPQRLPSRFGSRFRQLDMADTRQVHELVRPIRGGRAGQNGRRRGDRLI